MDYCDSFSVFADPTYAEENAMLTFLQPEMVELQITSSYEPAYSTEDQTVFTFVDVNGYVNDYIFIGEYLISRDIIYHIENPDVPDELMKGPESSVSLPSRSDFENLDRDAGVEDIIKEFGDCGREGSGIIFHVWNLDDGSKAKLV